MHTEAYDYVARFADDSAKLKVVDIGSRDINGTVRELFPNADYTGIDMYEGRSVDVVADGAKWKPSKLVDVVVCCEVFEHTPDWVEIIQNVHDNMLKKGGRFIMTAAGPDRSPHSGIDGAAIRPDEWYENIDPVLFEDALFGAGFTQVNVDILGSDVRAFAVK